MTNRGTILIKTDCPSRERSRSGNSREGGDLHSATRRTFVAHEILRCTCNFPRFPRRLLFLLLLLSSSCTLLFCVLGSRHNVLQSCGANRTKSILSFVCSFLHLHWNFRRRLCILSLLLSRRSLI